MSSGVNPAQNTGPIGRWQAEIGRVVPWPSYMKAELIIDPLEHQSADGIVISTGQQRDAAMIDVSFRDPGLRRPDCLPDPGPSRHATGVPR